MLQIHWNFHYSSKSLFLVQWVRNQCLWIKQTKLYAFYEASTQNCGKLSFWLSVYKKKWSTIAKTLRSKETNIQDFLWFEEQHTKVDLPQTKHTWYVSFWVLSFWSQSNSKEVWMSFACFRCYGRIKSTRPFYLFMSWSQRALTPIQMPATNKSEAVQYMK